MIEVHQHYPEIQPAGGAELKIINPFRNSSVFIYFTIRQRDNEEKTPAGEELFVLKYYVVSQSIQNMFDNYEFNRKLNPMIAQYQILDDIMQYPYSANVTLGYQFSFNAHGGLQRFIIAGGNTETWRYNAFDLTVRITIVSI